MIGELRKYIYRRQMPDIAQRADYYRRAGPDEVAAYQMKALNAVWTQAQNDIPVYANLARKIGTTNGFTSLAHYAETIPVMDKNSLSGPFVRSTKSHDFVRITGGSSGTPTHLPAWNSENVFAKEALLIGRLWNNVEPGDSLCLIWGHSHLLGSGLAGWLNCNKRRLKDLFLGYTRLNCYDLSNTALERMSVQLERLSFDYVLGYSRALDALARHVEARGMSLPRSAKAVIATAEELPFDDSQAVIERAFRAPLVMEYGAVETGPIAYTLPGAGYRVCWWSYLVEALDEQLLVTALYPRATPLFRYAIGDKIAGAEEFSHDTSLIAFGSLKGRSNTPVVLPSGRRLHSEVASHVFRAVAGVQHYQLECHADYVLGRYVAERELTNAERETLQRLSYGIDPEYGEALRLERCHFDDLTQAVSGKIPFISYKDGLKP